MLKSCKYCGRIHDKKHDCGRKPVTWKHKTKFDSFRSSAEWQRKRNEIRQRDRQICQWCFKNKTLTYTKLSVHHIVPLEEYWQGRAENDNLITLCAMCHELAERGDIPREELQELARSRE